MQPQITLAVKNEGNAPQHTGVVCKINMYPYEPVTRGLAAVTAVLSVSYATTSRTTKVLHTVVCSSLLTRTVLVQGRGDTTLGLEKIGQFVLGSMLLFAGTFVYKVSSTGSTDVYSSISRIRNQP